MFAYRDYHVETGAGRAGENTPSSNIPVLFQHVLSWTRRDVSGLVCADKTSCN